MKRLERFHNPSTIISPLLSVILFFFFHPFSLSHRLILHHRSWLRGNILGSSFVRRLWNLEGVPGARVKRKKRGKGRIILSSLFFIFFGRFFFLHLFFPWKPRYGPPRPRRRREEAFWRRLLPVSLPLFFAFFCYSRYLIGESLGIYTVCVYECVSVKRVWDENPRVRERRGEKEPDDISTFCYLPLPRELSMGGKKTHFLFIILGRSSPSCPVVSLGARGGKGGGLTLEGVARSLYPQEFWKGACKMLQDFYYCYGFDALPRGFSSYSPRSFFLKPEMRDLRGRGGAEEEAGRRSISSSFLLESRLWLVSSLFSSSTITVGSAPRRTCPCRTPSSSRFPGSWTCPRWPG